MPGLRLQGLQGQRPVGLAAQRARLSGQNETGGWMLSDGVEMARWLPALPLTRWLPALPRPIEGRASAGRGRRHVKCRFSRAASVRRRHAQGP